MAKINATVGVVSGTKTPSTAAYITDSGWGIDSVMAGYIIQNLNITHSLTTDPTQDQKGLTIGELDYDENWAMTATVIGNSTDETGKVTGYEVGEAVTFNGVTYKITSCVFSGTYNGKKQWTISGSAYKTFPATNG